LGQHDLLAERGAEGGHPHSTCRPVRPRNWAGARNLGRVDVRLTQREWGARL